MQQNTATYIILLTLTLLSACGRRPNNILSEDKFERALYDVHLAQAIYIAQPMIYDSAEKKDILVESVLAKHNITQAQFDSTMVWYSDNDINKYKEIVDSVASKFRKTSLDVREFYAAIDKRRLLPEGQVLPTKTYINNMQRILSFNIDSTKIKTKQVNPEHFRWQFSVFGVSSEQDLVAEIIFTYKDTSVWKKVAIEQNDTYEFEKPSLPDSLLGNISGFIRLSKKSKANDILIYNVLLTDSIPIVTNSISGLHTDLQSVSDSIGNDPRPVPKEGRLGQRSDFRQITR